MSDVGIVSINIHSFFLNYGAALHSFAFQKYLDKLGIDSVIVDYKSKHFGNFRFDKFYLNFIHSKKLRPMISAFLFYTIPYKRKDKLFRKFYAENCRIIDNNGSSYTYDFFNEHSDSIYFDFPIAVCESDVIWSPKTSNGFDRVFFCDYKCFDGKIKVAYAPSISNTKLTSEQETEFKRLVSNFDCISCREKETAEYVQKLIGKKCAHVLDPVLLLDEKDYLPYLESRNEKKYLLVYNVMMNDKKMISFAKKLAKNKGLKLIEISDFVRNKIDHKTLAGRSIGEFLWLIKNADYFVTNSFHGVCFAILFKKEFLVFERDGFDLKVKSLLEILDLENRFVYQSGIDSYKGSDEQTDWESVYLKVSKYKKISKEYIEESIVKNLKYDQGRKKMRGGHKKLRSAHNKEAA